MKETRTDSFERVPVAETTRAVLCTLAAGDLTRSVQVDDADWDEILQEICRNELVVLAYRYLAQGASRDLARAEFRLAIQRERYGSAVRMGLLYRHIGTVLAGLADASIDHLVLKGPALAHQVYPAPELRTFGDLDLMVRERDQPSVHCVLVALGFAPLEDPARLCPKLVPGATTYELKYWHRDWRLLVEVHFDDLLNAGLASRDIAGYWQRAVPVTIQGMLTKTLALDDQLIHLCAHMHYHGYTRLNWFSDLAFIVRDHGATLDWRRLIATVRREEAEVPIYYSLCFLDRLLGVAVPADVLVSVRPDRFRRWWHEHYLPERWVLSLQPMSRPDFSFYFLPLFKRLLPDMLVMGRRGEKLHYLARLLAPPREWLRTYYGLTADEPITWHYILHPLKLIAHYIIEASDQARSRLAGYLSRRRLDFLRLRVSRKGR